MTFFTTNPAPQPGRPSITGGFLAAAEAIDLMNVWFGGRGLVPKMALDSMLAKRAWDQTAAAISARE